VGLFCVLICGFCVVNNSSGDYLMILGKKRHLVSPNRFVFSCVLGVVSLMSTSITSQPAFGAGGGNDTGGGTGVVTPLTTNGNGFSFSQQVSGYNSSCGIQGTIGGNYGTLTAPYSSTIDSISTIGQANTHGFTVGANLIINSQKCTDPNKQLQLQKEQIQAQKDIACNQERGKIANLLLTQNPKATPLEVNAMLAVLCK
jgi:hypothetical protein